jgi:hypothetical protein
MRNVLMVLVVLLGSGCVDFSHQPHHDGVDADLRRDLQHATVTTLDAYQPGHGTDTTTVEQTANRMALWLQSDPELLARVRSGQIDGPAIRREVHRRLGHIRERFAPFQPRGIVRWFGEHAHQLTREQELLYAAALIQMSNDGAWREPEVGVPSR